MKEPAQEERRQEGRVTGPPGLVVALDGAAHRRRRQKSKLAAAPPAVAARAVALTSALRP